MTLSGQLLTLESSGLIRLTQARPELEYIFRHALVQEAAYDSLVRQDRKRLHLAVGEALERLHADRLYEVVPLLARHFDEAGEDDRALSYYAQAGDAAAYRYANAEAVAFYSRALRVARRSGVNAGQLAHLYVRRGRMLELMESYDEALANYQELEVVARGHGDRALELTALIARATVRATLNQARDPAVAQALSNRALALAHELDDRQAESKILWNHMLIHGYSGEPLQAIAYGEQSLAIARELNLREQMAYTLSDLYRVSYGSGRFAQARLCVDEADALWRELDNKPMLASNMLSSAELHYLTGNFEQAIALCDEARRIGRAIGNLWVEANSWMVGLVYLEQGGVKQGLEALREFLRLSEPIRASGLFFAPLYLAFAYERLGDADRALEWSNLAVDQADTLFPLFRPAGLSLRALACLAQGDMVGADNAVQAIPSPGGGQDYRQMFRSIALAEVELTLARREYARATAVLDETIARSRASGATTALPDLLYLKSKVLTALGDAEAEYQALIEARAIATAIGARLSLWPILTALSRFETQRDHPAEAEAFRREARTVIEFIAAHCPPEVRESFLNLTGVGGMIIGV